MGVDVGRIAVIGDVGGHFTSLDDALASLGGMGWQAAPRSLDDDLIVVQVGDLIDRGPASHLVMNLVRTLLELGPGRWVQLIGNHEAQYVGETEPFWDPPIAPDDQITLRDWWTQKAMNVAAAIRTADGDDFLITHAGLTVEAWHELGEPPNAAAAARLLNERPAMIWRDGDGLEGPGPLWASAGWDLHEPWMRHYAAGGFVPFGQIHGHSSIVSYEHREWRCPGRVRQRATVNWSARHFHVRVGGRVFIGVDPKHGRAGATTWAPLMFDGATLLSELPGPLGR
jgi:hypothetical protein